jgi:SAM-dependent methyltransferase
MIFGTDKSSTERDFPCELCGHRDYTVVWDKTEREKLGILRSKVLRANGVIVNGQVVVCNVCGLVYTNPRLPHFQMEKVYEQEYRDTYSFQVEAEIRHANTAYGILQKHIDMEALQADVNGKIKFLEVGASTARFTTLMKHVFQDKAEAIAIEPDKRAADKAKEINSTIPNAPSVDVLTTLVENYKTDTKFDFVVMLNTLEHMSSPLKALQHIRGLMDTNSRLLISVPNMINSLITISMDAWFSNAHFFHFSPHTLTALLTKAGFKTLEMIGLAEEVGEKMYIVCEPAEPQEITFDRKPNIGLIRQLFLFIDGVAEAKAQLMSGGYYK